MAQFKAGFIQSEIKAVSDKRDKNYATRRDTILGSNQYPNFLEKAGDGITPEIVSRDILTRMGQVVPAHGCHKDDAVEPLRPYRATAARRRMRWSL